MEGGPGDIQKPGGLGPVAVGKLQGLFHHHGGNRVNKMLMGMTAGQIPKALAYPLPDPVLPVTGKVTGVFFMERFRGVIATNTIPAGMAERNILYPISRTFKFQKGKKKRGTSKYKVRTGLFLKRE